jgi:hypothetical protein
MDPAKVKPSALVADAIQDVTWRPCSRPLPRKVGADLHPFPASGPSRAPPRSSANKLATFQQARDIDELWDRLSRAVVH